MVEMDFRVGQIADAIDALGIRDNTLLIFGSDNGPEFTARVVREWLARGEGKTLFIEPGSPWENGYVESFIGKLRDELLNREINRAMQLPDVKDKLVQAGLVVVNEPPPWANVPAIEPPSALIRPLKTGSPDSVAASLQSS